MPVRRRVRPVRPRSSRPGRGSRPSRGPGRAGWVASTARTSSSTASRSALGQHRDVAHRRDPLDHAFGRDRLHVAELGRVQRAEAGHRRVSALSRQFSWSRHGARFSTRSMIDHTSSTHGSLRSRAFHTSPSRPPGAQHARELGDRPLVVEPVPRLRDGDRVERRAAERQRFGGPGDERRRPAAAGGTSRAYPATGSTASRSAPVGASSRVSLPVPAARSATRRPGAMREVLDEPRDRVGRVRRPRRFVVGRIVEPGRRDVVHHAPILTAGRPHAERAGRRRIATGSCPRRRCRWWPRRRG